MAAGRQLPRNGVHAELAQGGSVDDGQESEVNAHKEIGHSQIADQKARDVDFGAGEYQDENDGPVSQQRHQENDPDAAPKRPPIKQILTGHKRTWLERAIDY